MKDKIYRYWATAIAGLEEVAYEQMREELGEVHFERLEKGRHHSRIYFSYKRSPRKLMALRSVDGVYALLAEMRSVTVGKPGLESIAQQLRALDMTGAQKLAQVLMPAVQEKTCRVNATVQGRHRFGASELVGLVHESLAQGQDFKASSNSEGLQLQMRVKGRSAVLGMRLVAADAVPGNAFAHCLGRILGLQNGDAVLWMRNDRAEIAELRQSFAAKLCVAWQKKGLAKTSADLVFVGSEEHMPIGDGACTHVLAQVRGAKDSAWIAELARILPCGGIAVVEVEHPEPFVAALRALPLEIAAALPLFARGRRQVLFVLERLPSEDLLQVQMVS